MLLTTTCYHSVLLLLLLLLLLRTPTAIATTAIATATTPAAATAIAICKNDDNDPVLLVLLLPAFGLRRMSPSRHNTSPSRRQVEKNSDSQEVSRLKKVGLRRCPWGREGGCRQRCTLLLGTSSVLAPSREAPCY